MQARATSRAVAAHWFIDVISPAELLEIRKRCEIFAIFKFASPQAYKKKKNYRSLRGNKYIPEN